MARKDDQRKEHQRADGRYQIQEDLGTGPDGRRIRKYFYGKSLKECYAKRERWMSEHPAGEQSPHEGDTVAQWIGYWIDTYSIDLKPATVAVRRERSRGFVRAYGARKLKSITQADVQEWINGYRSLSREYIASTYRVVAAAFRAAEDNGIIPRSPARGVRVPAGKPTEGHRALTRDEQREVLRHWQDSPAGMWAALMMLTGIRRGEALALCWEDVDLEQGVIRIRKAADAHGRILTVKTRSSVRDIPIPGQLLGILGSVPEDERSGFVLRGKKADPVRPICGEYAREAFNGFLAGLGIEATFHDLRYTYATILYDAGVDVKTAQALLGHADAGTTLAIYTQLSEETRLAGIGRLDSFLTANLTAKTV